MAISVNSGYTKPKICNHLSLFLTTCWNQSVFFCPFFFFKFLIGKKKKNCENFPRIIKISWIYTRKNFKNFPLIFFFPNIEIRENFFISKTCGCWNRQKNHFHFHFYFYFWQNKTKGQVTLFIMLTGKKAFLPKRGAAQGGSASLLLRPWLESFRRSSVLLQAQALFC